VWRVVALEEIKDFDTLKYEAVLMSLELQYSRRRLKEQAEEIARLRGQQPAEQLELELVKKAEQLARLRHKVFGDSSASGNARRVRGRSRRWASRPRTPRRSPSRSGASSW